MLRNELQQLSESLRVSYMAKREVMMKFYYFIMVFWVMGLGCSGAETEGHRPKWQAICGNGVIEIGEVCDQENVGDATCESFGYESGSVGCRLDCLGYDLAYCGFSDMCGNGRLDSGEVCNGVENK